MAENVEEFIKYENIKKISLKKLLSIVEENSEKADLKVISEKIKEEFGQLINDDIPWNFFSKKYEKVCMLTLFFDWYIIIYIKYWK